ncbi:hypothetical protein M9H77_19116 [Catharanthus roseus]|uniref:Uncharacterized protein n=1 Tax=Catharanthus roseus TaxID=4058 RepID=A0ACC0B9N4_CATRO|nr:hypothetical protein M9H77_19116 [Catharanthus roseus]
MVALVNSPSTFRNVVHNLQEEDCRAWFPFPHRIIAPAGIQDPGNLGTLLRSVLAFGWQLGQHKEWPSVHDFLTFIYDPTLFFFFAEDLICLQKVVPKLQLCYS